MERERIYCIRRSFVSESDSGIETLSLDGMAGSPKLPKLGTGKCRSGCERRLALGVVRRLEVCRFDVTGSFVP